MSRSKKAPVITDQNRGKPQKGKAKRVANKDVRNSKEIANGSAYKKHSCSWNIRDWSWYCPKEPKARRK